MRLKSRQRLPIIEWQKTSYWIGVYTRWDPNSMTITKPPYITFNVSEWQKKTFNVSGSWPLWLSISLFPLWTNLATNVAESPPSTTNNNTKWKRYIKHMVLSLTGARKWTQNIKKPHAAQNHRQNKVNIFNTRTQILSTQYIVVFGRNLLGLSYYNAYVNIWKNL